MRFADVILDVHVSSLDRTFQYVIPEELENVCVTGAPVLVPFGNQKKPKKGYVVGVSDIPALPPERLKPIYEVRRKGLLAEDEMLLLAGWIKEQYGGTFHDALRTVLPVKKRMEEKKPRELVRTADPEELREALSEAVRKKHSAKARLLSELSRTSPLPFDVVTGKMHISMATVSSLTKAGLMEIREKTSEKFPGEGLTVTLNPEQQAASDRVTGELGECRKYLLYGVTGSGKTEVYMSVIAEVLKQGKQAIVLIPEISLTYQTVLRFYRCFGDRVAFVHSKLSAGERYRQWEKAKNGEISIMIGPRSALFAPFPNLGLIVIDEEQEQSYKSDTSPKFHARETAIKRAEYHHAPVILGSATPSLEAFRMAESGEAVMLRLKNRAGSGMLSKTYVVDMREELKAKNRSVFSRLLYTRLKERLERGEQSMLFLNRRGASGMVSCRNCGTVLTCPHCDISLSEHANGRMLCHYCGYSVSKPPVCPKCSSRLLVGWKAGTEKIEELVRSEFPEARVLRMDADTTKRKEDYDAILESFANGDADILIGTQMIVKGHDFPNVTLMGVLAADLSLFAPDYRSAERTFQLLTQAAGRAGRGGGGGEVVIQTYQPEHYAVVTAAAQDYDAFYRQEIRYRTAMHYPPMGNMLVLLASAPREETVEQSLAAARAFLEKEKKPGASLIGPSPASRRKLNDLYRGVLYVKHADYAALVELKNRLERELLLGGLGRANILFDFNPLNGY